jgi:hypothetical protein
MARSAIARPTARAESTLPVPSVSVGSRLDAAAKVRPVLSSMTWA